MAKLQIEKLGQIALLFDFYGALLTAKQQEAVQLFYESDFSLSEIAREFQISRQAVYDLLQRSETILLDYENRLGLVKRFQEKSRTQEELATLAARLEESATPLLWQEFWQKWSKFTE
ncbi:MAG: YlxM family DNA-binding protein [Clostridiales bacterium]|jgi:predicted DNA-binding protein YlxM (UPF0122 family)|nr:YlxM family DNA-binding protein [Clostridiales bacterium]MDR2712202.1 YlxM family DNA-binding protein [Clostridiales bacterium]